MVVQPGLVALDGERPWISGFRNSLSDAKSCLTADPSVLIFVTVMVVLAPLRAVISQPPDLP